MDDRTLLVGQAPSRDGHGVATPFSGASGRRLASLMGVPHAELATRFRLANLLDRWPGARGAGDAFPLAEARAGWRRIADAGLPPRTVLIGFAVARACGYGDAAPLTWLPGPDGGLVAVVPHPSGLSRWWNDPAGRAAAAAFLSAVAGVA